MKKFFAILLAVVMMLSMSAMAYTITITEPHSADADVNATAEDYKAYLVFSATYTGEVTDYTTNDENNTLTDPTTKISYTIETNSPFYNVIKDYTFGGTKVFDLVAIVGDTDTETVVKKADYDAADLATKLNAVVAAGEATEDTSDDIASVGTVSVTPGETSDVYTISVEDKGYYFVTSTLGSKIIVDTLGNVAVNSKNEYPSVEKTADVDNASIDAVITFTIDVIVPATVSEDIIVTDTMEDGLTFIAESEDNAYTAAQSEDGQTLTWTIPTTAKGSTVTLVYTAYINTAAGEIYDATNTNTVYIEYSNYKSVDVTVDVNTYKASFLKVNGLDEALEGVTFKLTDAQGNDIAVVTSEEGYRVADRVASAVANFKSAILTTDANGEIVIAGLGNGTYYLHELTTLDGYNLLDKPFEFKIENNNNMWANNEGVDNDNNVIVNNTGSELPSTGGIGTTIFYVVGGLMMAAALVLLVAKRKVAASK